MTVRRDHKDNPEVRQPEVFVTGVSNAAFQGSVNDVTGTQGNPIRLSVVSTSASDRHIVRKPTKRTLSQKDKGYAWVILIVCVLGNIISSCGLSISGILLLELRKTFEASKIQLNIASTTHFAITLTLGLITGLFVSRFGSRSTMMIGSLLSAASVFATSFAPNIAVFTAIYMVSAVGSSCMTMSAVVISPQYFDKHKSTAFGLHAFGYSVSYFFWPPFATVLFEHYGWRSGFMILAGFQLQGCALAALMRPFKADKIEVDQKPTSACSHLLSQCQVFRNKRCMFFLFATCAAGVPYMFCPTYCPTLGTGLGATYTNAAFLVSIHGVCSGVSRVANGLIGDRSWMRGNRLLICVWGYTMAGISKVCSSAVTSYLHAILFAVADGFSGGSFTSVTFTIVTDMVSPQLIAFTSGIFSMSFGISLLIGNVFSGWLYSYFGTLYEPAFVLGGIQIFSGILATSLYIYTKLRDRKVHDGKKTTETMSTYL